MHAPPPYRPPYPPTPAGPAYGYHPGGPQPTPPPAPAPGPPWKRITLISAIATVIVVVIAVTAYLLLHKSTSSVDAGSTRPTAPTPTFSIQPPASPTTTPTTTAPHSSTAPADPYQFTVQAGPQQDACLPNATGQVADYLSQHGCAGLTRSLYTATIQNRAALVSVERVTGMDPASVPGFIRLITADGTGDIRTLLASGASVIGYPAAFVDQSTFLAANGPTSGQVIVLKAMWRDSTNTADDPLLLKALVAAERLR